MVTRKFCGTPLLNAGLFILRIGLGIYMLKASGSYLFEGKMVELVGFLDSLHWPLPELFAPLSQWIEYVEEIPALLGIRFEHF
jgi:uncharacterized membrane protein YphA (DoxX/SURF4 family)